MTEESTTPAELDMRGAPGGSRALAEGCLCSVLANAGYRAGEVELPLVDPRCAMHGEDPAGS
jgi:hypothetical protein